MDLREVGIGGQILRDLGVRRLRVLTNRPKTWPVLAAFMVGCYRPFGPRGLCGCSRPPKMGAMTSTSAMQLALRVVMMPRDTNNYGTIFGGVIMAYIDQAGFIEARRHGQHRWVTASIDRVDFHAPVLTGDVVSFLSRTVATGRSSVKVQIRVEAERYTSGNAVLVTEATMTMVAIDASGRSIPFDSPPSVGPAPAGMRSP